MSRPRCALPDVMIEDEDNPKKWKQNLLTYYINNRDIDLTPDQWDHEIEKAFKSWEDVCSVRFHRTDRAKSANIVLSIGEGQEHNFDGPGGTLAWAYLPVTHEYTGQLSIKFDVQETWIEEDSNKRGCLLRNVAAHEIGHTLGLNHSEEDLALMAPHYNPNISMPQEEDDIPRIQRLYG